MEELRIIPLSPHCGMGTNEELHRKGGLVFILNLEVGNGPRTWEQPERKLSTTLQSMN